MKSLILVLGVVLGMTASTSRAQNSERSGTLRLPERLSDQNSEDEQWAVQTEDNVNAKRTDGGVKITGLPMGSPDAFKGIEWSVAGSEVSGIAKGPKGQTLARFKGQLSDGQLRGTFTTFTGQTGDWEWEGPLPAELTAE